VQQEALELANCADIVTTGGSVNALLQLKHRPLDAGPGERVPSIHRSRDRVHSVSTAICAFTIHGAGSPSAYPLAFPEALASETIPHWPRMRWTPAPWERWRARGGRARQALLRSWKLFGVVCRVALFAGVLRDALWITGLRVQPFPMPFWAKPIIHVGLLFITTIP
jgi:hypothetical protein